jgi:DNA-binding winged helix-turn-helix (wHTH) protein/tetratricopeptide (TPR) repeat protein
LITPPPTVKIEGRTIDLVRGEVLGGASPANLTTTELKLLRYLDANRGRAVSRKELYVRVWGYHPGAQSRALDATMRRLRAKVEPDPTSPRWLLTVHGEGYRLVSQVDRPTLEIAGSRAVRPEWAAEIDRMVEEVRSQLDSGLRSDFVPLGVKALRTLRWRGPRSEARAFADELLTASLTPSQEAWIRAERLSLIGGLEFEAEASKALSLAYAHGEPALLTRVLYLAARGTPRLTRLRAAREFATQANSPHLQMQVLGQLANALPEDQATEIHRLYVEAMDLAHHLEEEWEEALIHANVARFLVQQGDFTEALRRYQRALSVFVAWEDSVNVVMAHLNMGVLLSQRMQFEQARSHFRLGKDQAKKMGARGHWVICRLNEMVCGEEPARLDLDELQDLLKACRHARYQPEEAAVLMAMGLAWASRGQHELARAPMEKAIDIVTPLQLPAMRAELEGNLALLELDMGDAAGIPRLRGAILELMKHPDQDAQLSKFLLRLHTSDPPPEPEYTQRLHSLASRLPAPVGTPWEGLAKVTMEQVVTETG